MPDAAPTRPAMPPPATRTPAADPPVAEPLLARSLRFTAMLLVPVAVGLSPGGGAWFPYGMLAAVVAFSADTGGRPLPRLAWMAAVAASLALGGWIGALVQGSPGWLCLAFAVAGIFYALTESAHPIAMTASRFLCFALALGALQSPFGLFDLKVVALVTVIAWLVSLAWDRAAGGWRPSTVPHWREVLRALHARELQRITFAVATAIAIPLAFLASMALSLQKPYWTMLTLVLVLRVDFLSSRKLMRDRFAGTLLGVLVAGTVAVAAPSHLAMLPVLLVAALLRWPAQQQHGLLGVAAMTAFVMLTIEIAAVSAGEALPLLEARILDTILGCSFALVALVLERVLRRMVLRMRLQRHAREL